MTDDPALDVFPCPFCNARVLLLIGRTPRYHYYACAECREIWTSHLQFSSPDTQFRKKSALRPIA